jgi:hypothetical protein
MKSLTDLTNAEMLESSLRWGMNLIAYSMGPQGLKLPPPKEAEAEFEKIYRYKGPPLPVLDDFTVLTDQWNKPIWRIEEKKENEPPWTNPTALAFENSVTEKSKIARVSCGGGTLFKSVITRYGDVDLSKTQALVFDLNSGLAKGINVSLIFWNKDDKAYETRCVFVRPGWNRNLRFPLGMGDFKSASNSWQKYDAAFEPRNAVARFAIMLYNLTDSGTVLIGPIREQKQ